MPGLFILIEGLDRSGKTTQCRMLADALQARQLHFPDRSTPTGQLIDAYLRGQQAMHPRALHLLFSANRWEASDVIADTLAGGQHLVVDRYVPSGMAFSVGIAGLDKGWCAAPDEGLPQPDLVFYLDVDQETAELQARAGQQFQLLRQQANWHVVDARLPPDEVHGLILQTVLSNQHALERPPLRRE